MALLSMLKRGGAALLGATALVASAAERMTGPEELTPEIAFVHVPDVGTFDELSGVVRNVDYEGHRVACYIYVIGSWWTKPNWTRPLTEIGGDGSWSCVTSRPAGATRRRHASRRSWSGPIDRLTARVPRRESSLRSSTSRRWPTWS